MFDKDREEKENSKEQKLDKNGEKGYNNVELPDPKDVLEEIDSKENWSQVFKEKMINLFFKYYKKGIYICSHGLARLNQRVNIKNLFTEEEFEFVCRQEFNYIQSDGKKVKHYNGLSIIYNSDGNTVVSVVKSNKIKEDMKEI